MHDEASEPAQLNLESLIGIPPGFEDDPRPPLRFDVLRRNLTALLDCSSKGLDANERFTLLNALTLLPARISDESILDLVDEALEQYILTYGSDSEAEFMLADLIVDEWPERRAMHLAAVVLERCPFPFRVARLLHHLSYMVLRKPFLPELEKISGRLQKAGGLGRNAVGAVLRLIIQDQAKGVRKARHVSLPDF